MKKETKAEKIAADINRLRVRLVKRASPAGLMDPNWEKFHALRLELATALTRARPR